MNTFNICCIGRNYSGKSTFINFILKQTKVKEFSLRDNSMNKVNVHNSIYPLKIYEIPGFQNEPSIHNSSIELSKLNKKLNDIQDEIHVILYFFNILG